MARYTLGIYWDDISVSACLVKAGMAEFCVEKMLRAPRECDRDHRPVRPAEEDLAELLTGLGPVPPETVVVSMPEREIMYRSLLRPFGDRRKLAQTIGPEVETLLPVLDGEVMIENVLTGRDEAGLHRIEALCVRRSSVEALLEGLKLKVGLDPEIVDAPCTALLAGGRNLFSLEEGASYLFVHMGWDDTSLAVLAGREVTFVGAFPHGLGKIAQRLIRDGSLPPGGLEELLREGFEAGELLDPCIREVLIALSRIDQPQAGYTLVPTGYACSIRDFAQRLAASAGIAPGMPEMVPSACSLSLAEVLEGFLPASLAIRGIDTADSVNFRKGDLAYNRKAQWLRGYAGTWAKVAGALVLRWAVAIGLDIFFDARIDGELSRRIQDEFQTVMPPGTPMVDPVKQLEQHLGRITAKGGGPAGADTPLNILRDVSASIPRDIDVLVDNIIIDENSIMISGTTKSYENVERIKTSLSALSYVAEVKIVSANVDKLDQRVRLKLVCTRKSSAT